MTNDDEADHDHRAIGRAMLASILYCAATGVGIGVFFEEPAIGGLAGAATGILLGFTLVPALMRD